MIILLIEPDIPLANSYAEALQIAGHQVVYSATAQNAIFAADAQMPDLVLLELQLVGHSGIEFLYEFRSYPEWQNIPVLVLSQVPPTEFLTSWELLRGELGVTDYLYKPQTTLVKLVKTVQKYSASAVSPNDFPAKAGIQ